MLEPGVGRPPAATDEEHPETGSDIWVLSPDTPDRPRPFIRTRFVEREARFSPDGRWVAYESNETGRQEIYVVPFSGSQGRWQVSPDGGRLPRWSPRGDELFYVGADRRLVSARVETGAGFRVLQVQRLTAGDPMRTFDVAPDGRSFITRPPDPEPKQMVVTLGWADQLRQMLPPP